MVRIGLHWPQSASGWMGGVIHSENTLRSLVLVDRTDVEVVVFEPHGGDFNRLSRPAFPGVAYVDYDQAWGNSLAVRAPRAARRTMGIPAPQMAAVVRDAALDVVFYNLDVNENLLVPWIAWIADFQHMHYTQYFSRQQIRARNHWLRRLAYRGSLVMLSSRDAERDFGILAPEYAAKSRVVPFATTLPDEYYVQDAADAAATAGIEHPYVVVPNQWWQHKNHETALRAARLLKDQGSPLTWVFTGSLDDYRSPGHRPRMAQLIAELELGNSVRVLGSIPRMEQVQLLRDCDLIVQPSLFEGWSTVVEDAKALGQRIVLSDLPVHREQEPPAALFFDPMSPQDLVLQVTAVLDGAVERVDEVVARAAAERSAREFGLRLIDVCLEAASMRR